MMKTKQLLRVIALGLLVLPAMYASSDEPGILLLKTAHGVVFVFNVPGNHFTLEVTGKAVKPSSSSENHIFLNVDGKFLQIQTTAINQFKSDYKNERGMDRAILEAHEQWEVNHISAMLKRKILTGTEYLTLNTGRECLLWFYRMPEGLSKEVYAQMYLSTATKDYVLVLNGTITDRYSEDAIRKFLLATMATLKLYAKPIDIKSLQQGLRSATPR